jgi:hypothetical protein
LRRVDDALVLQLASFVQRLTCQTMDGGGPMPAAGAQRGIISYGPIKLRVLAAAEGA